jgi:hypothetical protein
MTYRTQSTLKPLCWFLTAALLMMLAAGCSQPQKPGVKKIPAGKEFSGFLKDYGNLKPIAGLDGDALGFASADAQKNLHKYIACVVDPVEIYLATDADATKFNENARAAVAEYFRAALVKAVSDAYPVVEAPGPLVLRLRAAVVGVDVGGEVSAADKEADKEGAFSNKVNIGKVRVEMELVDSETGQQIAAVVDKENLGAGTEIESEQVTRQEKWAAAREAFDGWAGRLRRFLNASNELSPADAERADKAYQPYGAEPAAK